MPRTSIPHLLCHTYATELYRQSKDIRLVQKALGHACLSTTMIDTHIVDDDREAAIRLLNIEGAALSLPTACWSTRLKSGRLSVY